MTSPRPFVDAISASALLAFLVSCSGTAAQLAPTSPAAPSVAQRLHPPTNPQWVLNRLARGRATGRPWISPDATTRPLLYIANSGEGTLNVYSYSSWRLAGTLFGFSEPITMCVDRAQDVYVADIYSSRVTEYAHGAVTPTRTLDDHQGEPLGCAVDLKTGDLAVSNLEGPSSGAGNVIVYHGAKGSPTKYTAERFSDYYFIGYDANDDLFVDGTTTNNRFVLAELPKGKTAFREVKMNRTIGSPGALAWDGKFLAVGDQTSSTIYQFKVSSFNATVQGSTTLNGATDVFQFCLTGGSAKHPQATAVVGADFYEGSADQWDYPAGGTPRNSISGLFEPDGAVVSN